MAAIGKVSAIFTASTAGLTAGCSRAVQSLASVEHSLASLRTGMAALVTISGARFMADLAASASLAATRMMDMGKQEAELIDSTSKLAARLGTTYREMAGIGLAADLAGVSLGTIGKAMTKADVAFVRASEGSAIAKLAFDGIGVSLDSLQNTTAAERFSRIADAISAIPSEAERAAASIRLFGKAGTELLPLFADGAKGIGEATKEARLFGIALTNAQGRDVEGMNDAFTRAATAVRGIVVQFTARLAPTIQNITDMFTKFVTSAGTMQIGQGIGDALIAGSYALASVGDHAIEGFRNVFGLLADIGTSWETVFDAGKVAAGMFDTAAGALKGVIASIGFALTGAITVALQGVQTTLQAVGMSSRGLDASLAAMKAFTASLGSSAVAGFNSAGTGAGNIFGAVSGEKVARQMERPLTTMFETAVRSGLFRAQSSMKQTDFAARLNVSGGAGAAGVGAMQQFSPGLSTQAVNATSINSREGIAEMLRFIRGESNDDVAHEQLDVQREIAKNTAAMANMQDDIAFEIAGGY
jgi:hypothetical protein